MKRRYLLAPLFLLAACDDTPGKWSLYVYPNAHDQSHWQRTDRFKSEGMCRQAGEESLSALSKPAKGAFRCVETEAPY